ncbi:Hypothetical predicted protein [Mytilus galloprovincialis]|uniref:AIG1-type G domain-containing protein n=1 Tax=Mytilus galloprovincialis TaxID=29158 RepID=A0A8B6CML8_MYTGA|nr:Hypothetical predicted protein [Mytilus galloprovincialis]
MDDFNNEIRIVLFGKTGTGKSSTGNTILNREEFKAECQGQAVTDKSSFGTRTLNGRKLIVVDTPGLLDTHRDREEMKTEILRSVGICVPGPHAILFVMRIGDRLTDDDQNCIQLFTEMFGEHVFKYAIVVFTRENDLNGKTLNQYCQTVPDAIRNLLTQCSNRVIAFDNNGTYRKKNKAVNSLLRMIDNMIYGQTYYSNDLLLSAQVPFMARLNEIGQPDAVRQEIAGGGTAFKNVVRTLGPFIIGILISSSPSINAAKAVGSIIAEKVGSNVLRTGNVGDAAGVTAAVAALISNYKS